MKLIRLTDDRYILDVGDDVGRAQAEEIQRYFADWWSKHLEYPEVVVISGRSEPVIYEDRRDSDIENRVKRLEAHFHKVMRDDNELLTTKEPLVRDDPPVGGIEQYQAEDR